MDDIRETSIDHVAGKTMRLCLPVSANGSIIFTN